jgi:hypothetical protein
VVSLGFVAGAADGFTDGAAVFGLTGAVGFFSEAGAALGFTAVDAGFVGVFSGAVVALGLTAVDAFWRRLWSMPWRMVGAVAFFSSTGASFGFTLVALASMAKPGPLAQTTLPLPSRMA